MEKKRKFFLIKLKIDTNLVLHYQLVNFKRRFDTDQWKAAIHRRVSGLDI